VLRLLIARKFGKPKDADERLKELLGRLGKSECAAVVGTPASFLTPRILPPARR